MKTQRLTPFWRKKWRKWSTVARFSASQRNHAAHAAPIAGGAVRGFAREVFAGNKAGGFH